MRNPSVLFVREDSIYMEMGLDCWPASRDARNYAGSNPIIAHPPCRAWGRLKAFSQHPEEEKELARIAVRLIRENGGVLEHPRSSALWADMELPLAGFDDFGGWSLSVNQSWWGHRAEKKTLLYICGIKPADIPPYPVRLDVPTHVVSSSSMSRGREITKAEREATPLDFAKWLVSLASKCEMSSACP